MIGIIPSFLLKYIHPRHSALRRGVRISSYFNEMLTSGVALLSMTKVNLISRLGIIGSDTALETSKDRKKFSVFMRGIKMPEKYKKHSIGGIIAIPVKGFIVSLRAGDSIDSLKGIFSDRPIIKTISTDYIDLSSTKVRQMIKNGGVLDEGFVSQGVNEIIKTYDLYRE